MEIDHLDADQRRRESYHGLRLLPGAWVVVRVDGRSFSRFTADRFEKPFDVRFSGHMAVAAETLVRELDGTYAYTASDEISVVFPQRWDLFDRSVEKLVSISAGIASSAFTHACGEVAHFDSRIWLGTRVDDVVDYFSWRQADAARCALNGWCYWTLRKEGASVKEATAGLDGLSVAAKNELLFQRGINFNERPTWERRGVGLWWDRVARRGVNPLTGEEVEVQRRRLSVERELPMKDEYRAFVRDIAERSVAARTIGADALPGPDD